MLLFRVQFPRTLNDAQPPHEPQPPGDGQDTWQEVLGGFPRHLTTQLIDEEQVDRSHRAVLASWVLGLALTFFALAGAQERLFGLPTGGSSWPGLLEQLAEALGWRPESLSFVVSALCFGACLPVATSIGRALGIRFGLTLAASLVILLSPAAWIAATTPGLASPVLLVALLLLRELWREGGPRALPALCLGLGLLLLLVGLFIPNADPMGVLASDLDRIGQLTRMALLLPTLGVALAGLACLFLIRREEAEQAPPNWLLAWCLIPALGLGLFGSGEVTFAGYVWLLPPALIGCLDLLARQDKRPATLQALGGVALQLGLLLGALGFLSSSDPLASWRAAASEFLEPDDFVITTSRQHHYLMQERWGLDVRFVRGDWESAPARSEAGEATRVGRRALLDAASNDSTTKAFVELTGTYELRAPDQP